MLPEKIKTLADLHVYLYAAMQLEHATIPPYLMALYSIKPGTNSDATHVLRVVVVEEMLHLTLAANLMIAVGGKVDLTVPKFVPIYPAQLPDGEHDFLVGLAPFSEATIDTFLKIERPEKPMGKRLTTRTPHATTQLGLTSANTGYYSIGEFYQEIERGILALHGEMGDALFSGPRGHQISPDYYYSGGGQVHEVHNVESAKLAIRLIIEQGEGVGGAIYEHNKGHELAHFYRFQQLRKKKYYQPGDRPNHPSGPPVTVDWDAVYRFKPNVKLADYTADPGLHAAAVDFNDAYAAFLALLTQAFNGKPDMLIGAVPEMFKLRHKIERLIHNPMPDGSGLNAAPTFEIAGAPALVPA